MNEGTQAILLRRMTRSQDKAVAENPPTASRAVRLALTKAANDTVGLVLSVQGVAEEVTLLDDMLATLGDDLMLIGLEQGGSLYGLIALDMQLRAAIVEMQTMGALVAQQAEDRAPTRTDKTLSDPLVGAFLAAFPEAVQNTPLEGWMDGVTHTDRIDSTRAAGLVLEDVNYRIVRMSVDLGIADRNGMLIVALPLVKEVIPTVVEPPTRIDWEPAFTQAVSEATACFDALLHRFAVPLATAQSLKVGSVLPLPGCTVNSVRLIAPDGQCVGQAKLGQAGGHRAVRLECAPAPQLGELAARAPLSVDPMQDITTVIEDIVPNALMDLPEGGISVQDDGDFPQMGSPELPDINTG